MNYVITSGPALAAVSSDISYLALLNVTDKPYLLCTVVTNRTDKSRKLTFASDLSIMADAVEVLRFLRSATVQNGGQSVIAVNNDALAFAGVLKVCLGSGNTDIQSALAGIDCVLSVIAPTGTNGVFNTARYTQKMLATLTVEALAKATSASMVISKA